MGALLALEAIWRADIGTDVALVPLSGVVADLDDTLGSWRIVLAVLVAERLGLLPLARDFVFRVRTGFALFLSCERDFTAPEAQAGCVLANFFALPLALGSRPTPATRCLERFGTLIAGLLLPTLPDGFSFIQQPTCPAVYKLRTISRDRKSVV